MRAFAILIKMHDGSVGRHVGLYTDGCAAIMAALDVFPDARCVSALRRGA